MAAVVLAATRNAHRHSLDARTGSVRSQRGEQQEMPTPSHREGAKNHRNEGNRGRRSSVESVGDMGSMEFLLAQHDLPTQNVRRKKTLAKLCAGEQWQPRHIVLTDERLVCAKEGTNQVIDDIPLSEVRKVEKCQISTESLDPLKPTLKHISAIQGTFSAGFINNRNNLLRQTSQIAKASAIRNVDQDCCFTVVQYLNEDYQAELCHTFLADSPEDAEDWIKVLREAAKAAVAKQEVREVFKSWQERMRRFYMSRPIQILVAVLIFGNFITDAVETQIHGGEIQSKGTYFVLEVMFTAIFALEVCINLMANWFYPFFRDGWNVFDITVVAISLLSLALSSIPGLGALRLLRVVRVLRLFGRLEAMRRMVTALSLSVWPVINALFVLMIVMSVYAILGSKLFGNHDTWHFSSFMNAFFTMFQVVTYDNWASEVVMPLLEPVEGADHGRLTPVTTIFFLSFIIVVAWCMLPAVMALLLENFIEASTKEEVKVSEQTSKSSMKALDPLLETLSFFENPADLDYRISRMFVALDVEGKQLIGYKELCEGIRRVQKSPLQTFQLSHDNFEIITGYGALCNEVGELTPAQFREMMRQQLRVYVQRQASASMAVGKSSTIVSVLAMLKMMLLTTEPSGVPSSAAPNSKMSSSTSLAAWRQRLQKGKQGGTTRDHWSPDTDNTDRILQKLLKNQHDIQLALMDIQSRLPPADPSRTSAAESQWGHDWEMAQGRGRDAVQGVKSGSPENLSRKSSLSNVELELIRSLRSPSDGKIDDRSGDAHPDAGAGVDRRVYKRLAPVPDKDTSSPPRQGTEQLEDVTAVEAQGQAEGATLSPRPMESKSTTAILPLAARRMERKLRRQARESSGSPTKARLDPAAKGNGHLAVGCESGAEGSRSGVEDDGGRGTQRRGRRERRKDDDGGDRAERREAHRRPHSAERYTYPSAAHIESAGEGEAAKGDDIEPERREEERRKRAKAAMRSSEKSSSWREHRRERRAVAAMHQNRSWQDPRTKKATPLSPQQVGTAAKAKPEPITPASSEGVIIKDGAPRVLPAPPGAGEDKSGTAEPREVGETAASGASNQGKAAGEAGGGGSGSVASEDRADDGEDAQTGAERGGGGDKGVGGGKEGESESAADLKAS